MEILPVAHFDREYTIQELLKNVDCKKLYKSLSEILSGEFRIIDLNGEVVLGDDELGSELHRVTLTIQLEPVAYLESVQANSIEPVADLVVQILKISERYYMASELHLEAIHADYEKLQQKHRALRKSELRYKELSESLQQQVEEQVGKIEKAQHHLFQAEKLASVGQLAAGVAHEINNPVSFILSNLNTARSYTQELFRFLKTVKIESESEIINSEWTNIEFILDDFDVLLRDSMDGAERVAAIVMDLKDFSNVDSKEKNHIDINTVIQSAVNVVLPQIAGRAEIFTELHELPMLTCRPGHIAQVLLNMLLNSAAAMGDSKGTINVTSQSDGHEIIISVSDSGCGISQEIVQKIFEPFFTTHDVGEGTGLGLSVAYDVIDAHGGTIDVQSTVGVGTIFTIHLPVEVQ